MSSSLVSLKEKALRTIEANLVETDKGLFLTAGGNQFRTLWTRDFCFSVPGLLSAGWRDLVERQLNLILSFAELGQLPRGIDAVNPKHRVVWGTALRFLPQPFRNAYRNPLRAEYFGEHGTPAFDSNLVFLKAWAQLVAAGGSWGMVANRIPELLQPFTGLLITGELNQPAFSDWQDSARRKGAVLHTHLLLLEVLSALAEVDLLPAVFVPFEASLRNFIRSRYDAKSGLFREFKEGRQFGLDSHLLLINGENDGLLEFLGMDRASLYARLKGSPLWRGLPGVPIYPAYEYK